jgi:hypothetical protein
MERIAATIQGGVTTHWLRAEGDVTALTPGTIAQESG